MQRRTSSSSGATVATLLVLAAAFLLCHPYTGIRHDGTLYVGEALVRVLPGTLRDDIYFKFGSQGSFTLMPMVYAGAIRLLGIGTGTMFLMLLAFAGFLFSAYYLVASFTNGRWRIYCVLSVALGWTIYGGNRIFGYSESFLTARSFAEPVVLIALALLIRKRVIPAFFLLAIAALIHPLVASGGALVCWIYLVRFDRRWIGAGVLVVALLAVLGVTKVGPFSDVFDRYDDVWLALVQEANGHAFVARWSLLDYGIVFFDAAILWFAFRLDLSPRLKQISLAAITAGLGAIGVSLLLVDLIGNPFFGKLQLWRTEWLMQWFAMAMLPLVLGGLWKRPGEHGKVEATLLAIGWIAPFTFAPALVAVFAIALELARKRISISRTTTRIVCAVAVIAILSIFIQYEARVIKMGALLDQSWHQVTAQALTMNLLVLFLALSMLWVMPRVGNSAPFLALACLAIALAFWDQRPSWTRKLESYPLGVHIWPDLIDGNARIYWYRDLIAPWILLGHGNYYTQQQGSGAVFSRDMVVELDKRRQLTAVLDFQEQICRMMNGLNEKQGACEPDVSAVQTLCTDGAVDYVVLQSTLEGASPIADFSTGVVENGYEKKFFLYRCSALKSG